MVDYMIIQENITCEEKIKRFQIDIKPSEYSDWINVYEAENVGSKAICLFPSVPIKAIQLNILEGVAPVELEGINMGQRIKDDE